MPLLPRILLIEDDAERIAKFKAWLEGTPFVLVNATTGGQALGLVNRAEGVAGICLDHDLNTAPKTEMDAITSGTHVVAAIIHRIPKHVPILVHSTNVVQGERMATRLSGSGFSVTRIRMEALTEPSFKSWLADVHDNWDWDEE
ncbi:MAG: response regulator [Burkholderiales bacterium]|nr:response regulator [Burkholderiales bacterium]